MEVFKAFSTLTLTDMMSGPLSKIRAGLKAVDDTTGGLSARLGRLALAMVPVVAAAGVIIGAFGVAASHATDFESAMAGLGRAARFEQAELKAMGATVKDLAGRLPLAAEGIIALMTAGAERGITHADLAGFAEQAHKMGKAFNMAGEDAAKMLADWRLRLSLTAEQSTRLGDAVTYLSHKMHVSASEIGAVVQNAGALAKTCGVSEVQVAALGSAFLSVSAGPEAATTALKKFVSVLSRSDAMGQSAKDALNLLGFSAKQLAKDMQVDAQGTILKVMDAIAKKPEHKQFGILTELFGGQSVNAVAPILSQLNKVHDAFGLVSDATGYAGDMQKKLAAGGETTAGALALMRNKIASLKTSIGQIFLPMIGWAAKKLGGFADVLRSIAESRVGQAILKTVAVLALGATAVASFSTAMWGIGKLAPMLLSALAPVKAALLSIGWPVLAVVAAIALLYAAYRTNFGGIADTIDRWYRNVSLVFRGVIAVFQTLTGATGEIRGELARDIKAAGLVGFVTTVSKVAFRVKTLFDGIVEALDFSGALAALAPVGAKIAAIFDRIGLLLSRVFGTEVTSATAGFRAFGNVVGAVASWAFEGLAVAVRVIANGFGTLISFVEVIVALFRGDMTAAAQAGRDILDALVDTLASLADWLGIGDWLRSAFAAAVAFFDSIDLAESGARLIDTLIGGVKSAAGRLVDTVKGVFGELRAMLPFSDAETGPLSDLTLSGSRLMSTLAQGVDDGSGKLLDSVEDALGAVTLKLEPIKAPALEPTETAGRRGGAQGQSGGPSYVINISNISLPNVKEAKDFLQDLQDEIDSFDGGLPA